MTKFFYRMFNKIGMRFPYWRCPACWETLAAYYFDCPRCGYGSQHRKEIG